MKTVAYCRVSTNKEEQQESLVSQQLFFSEYSKKNNYDLIRIYADEGKSGTKMKNRTQLLKLLSDAERGLFEVVLIKDVSRLARNTLDFLDIIRKLKSLSIKVIFVNYDQTSSDSSEFTLTLLSAMAQEESANTSKRVKFGKKVNMEKGKVPNLIYGYDKVEGDYFTLNINKKESEVVKEIFDMYINQNLGVTKIAMKLRERKILTKRNCQFSQNAVSRILQNPIYNGIVANGKTEVSNFLTGERDKKEVEDWYLHENPDLKIIDDETFENAQKLLAKRNMDFKITKERNSQKYIFSKLIKCECCNYSFRRVVYKNNKGNFNKWVCYGRSMRGIRSCNNKTVLDEIELTEAIKEYLKTIISNREKLAEQLTEQFERTYKKRDEDIANEKELTKKLNKVKQSKKKYMDMYDNDIIDMIELKRYTADFNTEIEKIQNEIEYVKINISKSELLRKDINTTIEEIERLINENDLDNAILSRLVDKIVVNENKNVNIHINLLGGMELDENLSVKIHPLSPAKAILY